MTYLLIAAAIVVAIVLGFVLAKIAARQPTPKFIAEAEREAWDKLEELLEYAASNKGDQKVVSAAQARMTARDQRKADFKAKVASL